MPSLDPYILQPLTLLDAVNAVLANIGSGALQTLEGISLGSDAEDALKQVHNWLINVQQKGWFWNTEHGITLNPDDDGLVAIPANTLKVDPVGIDAPLQLTWRGKYLYDREAHTSFLFRSVIVDLVLALDFEDIPQAARTYVTVKAARQFAQFKMNNGTTNQFTRENEGEAFLALLELEDETDDRTLKDTNAHFARRRNIYHQG